MLSRPLSLLRLLCLPSLLALLPHLLPVGLLCLLLSRLLLSRLALYLLLSRLLLSRLALYLLLSRLLLPGLSLLLPLLFLGLLLFLGAVVLSARRQTPSY